MTPFILYDLSHLSARFWTQTPSGIDRVDLLLAKALSEQESGLAACVYNSKRRVSQVTPARFNALLRRLEANWREDIEQVDQDPIFTATAAWLAGDVRSLPPLGAYRLARKAKIWRKRLRFHYFYRQSFNSLTEPFKGIPEGGVYFNASQWSLDLPHGLDWLARRPDVKRAFYVYDLLPLDYPEFFPAGERERFQRISANLARHADGLIVASETVAERVRQMLTVHGRTGVPILVEPLPAIAVRDMSALENSRLRAQRYFICVGTIEPRKNHLLLLNIWRDLAAAHGAQAPKLVVVGARGWKNEQVLHMLEGVPGFAAHVAEITGLSTLGVRTLIHNATALLQASFDEGFGLPLVEAIASHTPIVASDIAIFHEVAGDAATYCAPLDGPAWRAAIEHAAAGGPPLSPDRQPTAPEAFTARVIDFLKALQAMPSTRP